MKNFLNKLCYFFIFSINVLKLIIKKKSLTLCLLLVLGINEFNAQIYVNTFTGVAACPTNGNTPTMATNSTGSALSRSTITCNSTANVFNSTTLNNTSSISNTSYIEFSATANSGYILNLTSVSFFRQGSNSAPNQMEVRYSTNGFTTSTNWGSAPVTPTTGTTATWDFADFSTGNGGTVTFRIYPYGTTRCDLTAGALATGTFRVDDVTINGTVSASPSITIGGSTSVTATAFSTTYGTASANQSFTIAGSNLTADISVAAVTGFEYSIDGGSSWGTTRTITQSGGSASATLLVRLAATATVSGSYNSQSINLSSTGATTRTISTTASGNAVSAKGLTISGLSAANKNYDGNTTVSVTGTAAYSGLVNGESFTPSDVVTWAFPDANVGSNKTLISTGSYSAPSTNYSVTQPTLTANISAVVPSAPTITSITPGNQQLSVAFTAPSSNGGSNITNYEYSTNGGAGWTTPNPSITASPFTISSLTNGTTYDVQIRAINSAGSGTASSTTQGTPAAPSSPTITGAATATAFTTTYGTVSTAQIFSITGSALTADIIATAPTGFEVSGDGTTYGSTATFTQSGGSASGTLRIRLTATAVAGGIYNNQNIVLSSTGASSVNITTASSGNSVSQKALSITTATVTSKVYNRSTTSGTVTPGTLSGFVGSETVVVSSANGTYADWNIGTGKTATITYILGNGTNGGLSTNYSLANTTAAGDITSKALTVTSSAVTTKTYDGNTNAIITGSLSGVETGDVVSLTGTGTFASANVGTGINVTSTSTLGGADAGNYTLTQPTGLTGEITKSNQTITFGALANKLTTDAAFNLTATSTSGLTVSYSSSNTSVATIVGNTVTIVGAGTTTITASQSGNSNYNAASDVPQSLTVTLPDIEEIIFPQYIQGVNGTNSNRIPSAYYLKINNLNPNTTYRFYCGLVLSTDASTSSGAGNNIYVNYAGGAFTRSSSPSLSTAGNYSTLTTNSNGAFTGWFIMEPTGNATRFVPGNNLFLRITLNDGNNGTTAVNYRTSTNTIKVINLVNSSGTNNGTGLYGTSLTSAKNFVVLYDNVNGSGRPISTSYIEDDGTANTTANSYSSFYNTNVNGVSGAYGVVIPNDNTNGIKRVEFKKTSDNSLIYAVTDNDGNWAGTVNTVNPTGGTTAISLPHHVFDDAIFNESNGINLTQNTTINGTLTLSNGALNINAFTLTLNGSIIRTNGNIDATNTSATINFNGSSAQSIPSSVFSSNINNITLNNSSGLTINQNITINNNLTLTNGKLIIGNNNLILGENASIQGTPSVNAMIIPEGTGELRKFFNTTNGLNPFTFPVGDNTNTAEYSPVTIDFSSATFDPTAYVSLRLENAKHPELSVDYTNYIKRNWTIEQSGISTFNYDIILNYSADDFITDGLQNESDLIPIKKSGYTWYQPDIGNFTDAITQGTANINTTTKCLTWSGLSSFSQFGAAGKRSGPLPIELIEFNLEKYTSHSVQLNWKTKTEINNDYFTIEKSEDGNTFFETGKLIGAGNSTEELNYSFIDENPFSNINYYRIKQTDYDKKFSYSVIKSIDMNEESKPTIYPNPINDGKLSIDLKGKNYTIQLINNLGQILIDKQNDGKTLELNLADYSKGIYFIKYFNKRESGIIKTIFE